MRRSSRLTITPGTAVAILALFFALGGSAFAVGERVTAPSAAQQRCANGAVRGIAVVTGIPSQGIANIPGTFTGARTMFARRFNCTGKAIQVRRVEFGVYEVRFVGIGGASATGSAVGDAYLTVEPQAGGVFRVIPHPAGRDDRADLAFTLVVV